MTEGSKVNHKPHLPNSEHTSYCNASKNSTIMDTQQEVRRKLPSRGQKGIDSKCSLLTYSLEQGPS